MASETDKSHRGVALITGASGGLGKFVAPAFLAAGYRVAAVDLRRNGSSEIPSPRNFFFEADLSRPNSAEAAVSETNSRLGPVDCLVHLVGAFTGGSRIEETADEVWDQMWRDNLRTAVNILRAVIPQMRARKQGRIIVVGSTAALQPVATWGAFSVAVAGLGALVKVAAAELFDAGVTVNAVLPTTIDTPAIRAMIGDTAADRAVAPESLVSLILWLCSDQGKYMSGAFLPVAGGMPHPCGEWHELTDREAIP
jgi:3-oxoacyl-[acyl-carrier protein] reductase